MKSNPVTHTASPISERDVAAAELQPKPKASLLTTIRQWFDSDYFPGGPEAALAKPDRFEWQRALPFAFLHLGCLLVIIVGWSWTAVAVAAALYVVRMFAITGFYHRYFSHKAFSTSRPMQFLFAVLGAASVQRGPLWWAAHHRHHHRFADTEHDIHSPRHGFWRSHMGWFLTPRSFATNHAAIKDLTSFPELRLLDRFDILVPALLAVALYAVGSWLGSRHPALGTDGPQLLVWGFFISTIVLFHVTVTINSLAHRWGTRRFATNDDSRNNFLLALLTFGEGWHNNHHHFPGSARQGFRWWEIDLTYYVLRAMSWIGLVWDLKAMPASLRNARPHPR